MYGYNSNPYQQYQQLSRVNGIEGAKAYQIMPGCTVALFDANEDVFYVKSADNAGFSSVRTFKFEEIQPDQKATEFVSRKEMEDYVKQLVQSAITEAKPTTDVRSNQGESRSNIQSNVSDRPTI